MLILIAPLILLVTAFVIAMVRLTKPTFAYYWLISTSGSLLAWIIALLSRLSFPGTFSIPLSNSFSLSPFSFSLAIDDLSWYFSIAIITLLLALHLTKVARNPETNPRERDFRLANDHLITAFTVLALLADNLLTLLILLVALDLLSLSLWIKETSKSESNLFPIIPFSLNAMGIFILILASISPLSAGLSLDFNDIPTSINLFLLMACGARLAVIPISPAIDFRLNKPQDLSIVIRIVPLAATLLPLVRIAEIKTDPTLQPFLLIFPALGAMFAALSWWNSPDEISGYSYWILGVSALVFASSVRSQASAAFTWSMILLLPGSFLTLYTTRQRWLQPIFFLTVIGLSSLPYTPAWNAVVLYGAPFQPLMMIFLLAQVFLTLGFLKFGIKQTNPLSQAERWIWIIYPWGLLTIPLMQFLIVWWNRSTGFPTLMESWPGIVSSLLVLLLFFWKPATVWLQQMWFTKLLNFLSLQWFFHLAQTIYRNLQKLFIQTNNVLEGNGSILWVLALLALLVSLFIQFEIGGF